MTEHDKRREYWVDLEYIDEEIKDQFTAVLMPSGCRSPKPGISFVHVREVRPGEITITRNRLEELLAKYDFELVAKHDLDAFMDELFPEGKLSNE